jgi:murein DD-endopeptidase MepM/ murein hydrolase activator NlpD
MDGVSDWACQGFTSLSAAGIVVEMATAMCRLVGGGCPLSKNLTTFFHPFSSFVISMLVLSTGTLPVFSQLDTIPFRVADINQGELTKVVLSNGTTARVELLERAEKADTVRGAVRLARVRVKVNGDEIWLDCGNYRLPAAAGGVQIDCPVTKGLLANSRANPWAIQKDARLRLWPAGSPFLKPGTYVYPVKQRWFATDTQMSNQPSYVDGSEEPSAKQIYYHHGLDVGGAEGLTEVISATDGRVVVRGRTALPEYVKSPYTEVNYDGVIVRDDRGWFHWYFHLFSIDASIKLGERVRMGQPVGLIGKEGSAGCWSHLHYEIRGPQPSGKAGIIEGYAFLWEAYLRQHTPDVIAVARPHSFVWVGEPARLDGRRSWARAGVARYEWALSDGSTAGGPSINRTYRRPGTYSEVLKVTDRAGRSSYDFAVVQVVERPPAAGPGEDQVPPTIHASYWPAMGVRAGQPVVFLVRTCRTTFGQETWDFRDGSAQVSVRSDGCAQEKAKEGYARTEHVFRQPGDYLVKVERTNERGERATAHLWVPVGP